MNIVEPSAIIEDVIDGGEILKKIEKAGRTCYKSEDKITEESARQFIKFIIERGHETVLEHEKVTVRIICDRGVSHEIVRHRIASYSQESTRYCNYSKDKFGRQITFIKPLWARFSLGTYGCIDMIEEEIKSMRAKYQDVIFSQSQGERVFLLSLFQTEHSYFSLIDFGWQPQEARSVLPNSLKTEIVVTMNLREWRHFFKLRISSAAHPQMQEIAMPLLNEFKRRMPVIFDDIKVGQ